MENTKAKRKPIIVTFIIAIIIGIICLAIYLCKYYQPELEMPPKIVVTDSSGQKKEMLLTSYDWTYKGETKTFDMKIGSDENIIKYNYDIDNIFFADWDLADRMSFKTEPEYKNCGFVETGYQGLYDSTDEIYYSSSTTNQVSKIEYVMATGSSNTEYVEVTLKSEKQGSATYLLKVVDTTNFPLKKIKTEKLSKNAEEIEKYLKDTEYGHFLNGVQVEENKVKISYDYWVNDTLTSDCSAIIFTLLDDVNEIEYTFLQDKYIERNYNYETDNTDTLNFDKVEPVIYSRDKFITKQGLRISELQDYINK